MGELRVGDTSPLVYLSRTGLLHILSTGADRVIVPQAVVDEITGWPTAAAQKAIESLTWIEVAASELIPSSVIAWDLGPGESAVLAYGISHPGCTLVIDDLAARRSASALGIPFRSTLGLVLIARK